MDMNTSGMKTLVYKRYGVVLFDIAVQLKLFPETKMNSTTVWHKLSKYSMLTFDQLFQWSRKKQKQNPHLASKYSKEKGA